MIQDITSMNISEITNIKFSKICKKNICKLEHK